MTARLAERPMHTPGPWHASAIRTHGANPSMNGCDIGAENGANVAIALHQPQDRDVFETIANARLLAAAPALLAALKPFAQFACDEPCDCFNCRARDAVAKAQS